MLAGQVPPKPPAMPPRPSSVWVVLSPWLSVKNATASAWLGMAPMKNADWALLVVPVLPTISWPLLIAALGAVP